MASTTGTRLGRRGFLRLGAAAAATSVLPARKGAAGVKKATSPVWRLSTHGRRACHACKAHGANLYFRAPSFAERTRAHAGCNCPVIKQQISQADYQRYFPDGAAIYDNRTGPRKFKGV